MSRGVTILTSSALEQGHAGGEEGRQPTGRMTQLHSLRGRSHADRRGARPRLERQSARWSSTSHVGLDAGSLVLWTFLSKPPAAGAWSNGHSAPSQRSHSASRPCKTGKLWATLLLRCLTASPDIAGLTAALTPRLRSSPCYQCQQLTSLKPARSLLYTCICGQLRGVQRVAHCHILHVHAHCPSGT